MKEDHRYTVLCVDDEENILNALKRLLRREHYRLLTALSSAEGLELIHSEQIQLVISDQRMPGMSGTEFLAKVKEDYPDIIRIVLTGYTDVESITESINRGHIYKFLLKPWNDETLKLEIRQALDQYDLIQANKDLNARILEQNERLKEMNENLETLVRERTRVLEIQNRALELSRAILERIPLPVIGVSSEGLIVLVNQAACNLASPSGGFSVGNCLSEYFPSDLEQKVADVFSIRESLTIKAYPVFNDIYDIEMIPIRGPFQDKGLIMALKIPEQDFENLQYKGEIS